MKTMMWFPCLAMMICVVLLISSGQYTAAWFAGMAAFFAWMAILYRQAYFEGNKNL